MEIELAELFQGKSTIIKDKEYEPTKTYIEPFINEMSKLTSDFRVNVVQPKQITVDSEGQDLTYNRVWVQAVLPDQFCVEQHDEVISMLYGLDVKNPVVKFYRGYLNRACTNLCVFDPQWLNIQSLKTGEIDYSPVKKLMEYTSSFGIQIKDMKSRFVDRENITDDLGRWIDNSLKVEFNKVRLSTAVPIKAYKNLFMDAKSASYIPNEREASLFDVYNAFTQVITDEKEKDVLNSFEKTMLVNQILL
jgi:hypothetical protein